MAEGGKTPAWVWALIALVAIWLIIREAGTEASKVVGSVGKAKSDTAKGYASAATSLLSGLGAAIGSFVHSGGASSSGTASSAFKDDMSLAGHDDAVLDAETDVVFSDDV